MSCSARAARRRQRSASNDLKMAGGGEVRAGVVFLIRATGCNATFDYLVVTSERPQAVIGMSEYFLSTRELKIANRRFLNTSSSIPPVTLLSPRRLQC